MPLQRHVQAAFVKASVVVDRYRTRLPYIYINIVFYSVASMNCSELGGKLLGAELARSEAPSLDQARLHVWLTRKSRGSPSDLGISNYVP